MVRPVPAAKTQDHPRYGGRISSTVIVSTSLGRRDLAAVAAPRLSFGAHRHGSPRRGKGKPLVPNRQEQGAG